MREKRRDMDTTSRGSSPSGMDGFYSEVFKYLIYTFHMPLVFSSGYGNGQENKFSHEASIASCDNKHMDK